MNARLRRVVRTATGCLLVLVAGSCSLPLNGKGEVQAYDFGPVSQAKEGGGRMTLPVLVYDVTGPAWMESPAIFYRLAYVDSSRPLAYASSRWVMPPAALLSGRLRQRLSRTGGGVILPSDGLRASAALRVELEEFAHVFDAEAKSRAVVRLRASLAGPRSLIAQKSFSVERAAASPNAEGGVRALSAASDEALEQVLDWMASSLTN